MSIGEYVAIAGFCMTILGLIIRYGLIKPFTASLNAVMTPLKISVDNLTEQMKESSKDRRSMRETLNQHEVQLAKHDEKIKNLEHEVNE